MKDELINLFFELVKIDSVSGEEQEISNYVFNYLQQLGLKPEKDEHNMVYCDVNPQRDDSQKTLFSAHMDTVDPGRGVKPQLTDNYITSSGDTILGADNKASLSVILYNVKKLINAGKKPNIELVFTVREESNSGIKDFDLTKIKSKKAILFDKADAGIDKCIMKAPYIYDIYGVIQGKAAHASRPYQGINALNIFIDSNLHGAQLDEESTFNIGVIKGGSVINSVPEEVTFTGDLRSYSYELIEDYKIRIIKNLKGAASKYGGKANITWDIYSTGYSINEDDDFFKEVQKKYSKLDIDLLPIPTQGGSDASHLNHNGIKALCLADGSENVHSKQERIHTDTLNKLGEICEELMEI